MVINATTSPVFNTRTALQATFARNMTALGQLLAAVTHLFTCRMCLEGIHPEYRGKKNHTLLYTLRQNTKSLVSDTC